MKKILFLFAFYLLSPHANAQIQWQKQIGGSGADHTNDIHQTSDGGYIVSGFTNSNDGDVTGNHGSYDAWVVKLSSSGGIEWQKCLGGSGDDYAYSVQQTSDGGFIVTGTTESSDGDVTDKHGLYADLWVVKLSPSGALIWQKSLGGSGGEEGYSVKETSDGGYIVAGRATSNDGDVTGAHGQNDVWVVKLSNSGAIEWQKAFGGSDDDVQTTVSISQTADGGYVFVTSSNSTDGDIMAHHGNSTYSDCWVVKLSVTGSIEWEKSLGGSSDDIAYSIWQTLDGGYVITGGTFSSNGDVTSHIGMGPTLEDLWIVKLSAGGAVEWNKCIDEGGYEFGSSIQQTSDTGYIVCGGSDHGLLLVKFAEDGTKEWALEIAVSWGAGVSQTIDGGYVVSGSVGSVVKLGNKPGGVATILKTTDLVVSPNPATDELVVSSPIVITDITICNMTGQAVYINRYNAKEVRISIADLSAGIYLLRINNTDIRKFVKE